MKEGRKKGRKEVAMYRMTKGRGVIVKKCLTKGAIRKPSVFVHPLHVDLSSSILIQPTPLCKF